MTQYVALLYIDPDIAPTPGTPEQAEAHAGYVRFGEANAKAILGGEALQGAATATTVRTADGGTGERGAPLVTSGPFAEVTEAIGGYYALEADTLDDAIDLARQIPAASHGAVELRPVVIWEDYAPEDRQPPAEGEARYVALLLGKESEAVAPGTPGWDESVAAHARFGEAAAADSWGGAALHPTTTATTVRVREGEVLVTDGPFTEAVEVIGGFYQFGALAPERATELAALIPEDNVELRPIMEWR